MSVHTSLRIPSQHLARIDQLAAQHGLNRTEYMIQAALGELTDHNRYQAIEQRLNALEQWKQSVIDSQGNW